jgi:hypothetical protein
LSFAEICLLIIINPPAEPVARLRTWVEHVYVPGYGHLAATLGSCWEAHDLCLYALDIAASLWSVLYLQPVRTPVLLSAQAEYQARILPALADLVGTVTIRLLDLMIVYKKTDGTVGSLELGDISARHGPVRLAPDTSGGLPRPSARTKSETGHRVAHRSQFNSMVIIGPRRTHGSHR